MSDPSEGARRRNRIAKAAFAAGALVSVLAGLVLYLFADAFGLDHDTAELVAIAFLGVGAVDALLLGFWDRLFRAG